jgi:hypothetical protein
LFPPEVRRTADRQFALLSLNPRHPSLHFKPIPGGWSARVTLNVRALARRRSDGTFVWFWIGSHDDYDKLIKQA